MATETREERRERFAERRLNIPKGRRPEEFLDDVALADYYRADVKKHKKGSPERQEAVVRAIRARQAASAALLAQELAAEEEDEE